MMIMNSHITLQDKLLVICPLSISLLIFSFQGDSGAGLQGDYKDRTFLVGVHSLGPNICYSGTPHLLTDIRRYTGMICHITGICYHLSAFV